MHNEVKWILKDEYFWILFVMTCERMPLRDKFYKLQEALQVVKIS